MHLVHWDPYNCKIATNLPHRSMGVQRVLLNREDFSEHQVKSLLDDCILYSHEILKTAVSEVYYETVLWRDEIHLQQTNPQSTIVSISCM